MPTRPRHYAVFILNPDGSGTVKQFDTWQEAMTAYADSSNAGKAVYLYPQPLKAVGITPTGPGAPAFTPPAAAPIQFTAAQNVGQYQWPPHPPLPRPTSPGGIFSEDWDKYNQWMDYCKANPGHRECSIPGKPKFGTQTLVCTPNDFTWKSTDGTEYPGSRPKIMLADGMGGTFESEEDWYPEGPFKKWYPPCEYPNGFREYQDFDVTSFKELAISSLVGQTVQTVSNPLALMRATRRLVQYSNNVASEVRVENGVLPEGLSENERELEVNALREYEAGQPVLDFGFFPAAMGIPVLFPLKPESDANSEVVDTISEIVNITVTETGNTHQVGNRTADVLKPSFPTTPPDEIRNVNYDAEAGIGSGTWNVVMTSPTELEFVFTPTGDTPPDARPPEGWAGVVVRGASPDLANPRGGDFEGIDTTGVPAGGTYQGPWTYFYFDADILLDSDDDNDYYTNGQGGYYVEAKEDNPDTPNPVASYDYEYNDIVIEESGQEVRTGSRRRPIYENSNIGEWEPWVYDPLGTPYEDAVMSNANWRYTSACGEFVYKNAHKPITADGSGGYTVGEEVDDSPESGTVLQTCEQENLRYIADGEGYYTTEEINPPPPCEDSSLHAGEAGWSYDGCYWSYSEPPPPPDCEDSNLHVDGQDGWSYDGCYWTYTPNCPSSGEMVGSTNEDVTYSNECGTYTIGVSWSSTYADGSCGTYMESGTTYNVGSIGECNGYDYVVNEDGSVTSSQNCDPSGTISDYGTPSDLTYETPCGTYTIGTTSQYTYADGMCGSYQSVNNTYNSGDFTSCNGYIYSVDSEGAVTTRDEPYCPPSGEWISSDDCNNYYTDGNCGSYSMDNGNCGGGGGGGCDSSGIEMGTGSDPVNASTPCGDVQVGYTDYTDYTDGSCGSYRSYGDPVYVESGTQVASCNDCTYYSNGDGTVSEDCTPPPPPCEPSDLHVEGEDGWTYDGCHWNQQLYCYGDPTEPSATDDESPESNGDTDFNTLYNEDGSVYATYDGQNWNVV
jgi:hypothetical protein